MDDEAVNIMSQSKRRLTKLKLLSNFFENVDIISIFIKTDIIHKLFEENKTLDCHKLELFHLQYTDSLIELLNKIKKKKENDLLAVINEININNQYISAFEEKKVESFETDRKLYSGIFSEHLKSIYKDLTEDKSDVNWNDVLYFQKKYAMEFYRADSHEDILKGGAVPSYEYQDYQIERKLLGKLNIQNFKVRFVCGYRLERDEYELFKIFQTHEYFIFDIEGRRMYLMDNELLLQLDISENESNQLSIINQLNRRNEELEESIHEKKRTLPDGVGSVLKDYLHNLESMDIMSTIFDVNEETNILRAMLNLNLNN
ncbi:hypothetical protein [Chryseobacterium potabilaquae]|uniref:Rho-GAP domain-containing protein n=1 Tax=Chryseobacterium potabilaquae TaxID=2675057 RepID=A0A6N4X6B7_9FLAO|nr:hypothetical protein [Chryseobacterium potabilaquae]CAA7194938.1 hypothetical protein CHRY9293_01198 [Chryseobacterium potabilaquae]